MSENRQNQVGLALRNEPKGEARKPTEGTAARVAKLVFESGLARVDRPADMVAFIRQHVYKPEYANESAG